MKHLLCTLLVLIGLCPLHALRAQEQSEVDSLHRIVESLPRGTERLNQLARLVRVTQLTPEGINYARQLYTEAMQQHNDTLVCTAAAHAIGNHYSFSDNATGLDSIRHWASIGIPLSKKLGIWKFYFEMKKALTCAYIFNSRFEFALEEAKSMAAEAEEISNYDGLANAYLCMGMAYQGSKRWKECWEMLQKAHSLFSKDIYPTLKFNILFQCIDYLYVNNRSKDILPFLDEGHELIDQFLHANPYLESALSGSYFLLTTYAITSYSKLGQTQQASQYIPQAQKWRNIMNLKTYDKFYFEALCDYYTALKQFDKAVAYGDSVQAVIVSNGLQADDLIFHLERQADLYYTMGDYDQALPLYQRSKALRDSINRVIADRQMDEIKEMYAMDHLALEEAKMRQRVQWAIIGSIFLVIGVMIFLWRRNYHYNKQLQLSTQATSQAAKTTQEANEQKRRFLSTMSHAIRVPLHSVVGFSQLLSTDPTLTDEERNEYGEIVRFNTEQLMFLVNSVLDLSRLEAGMTKWQMADYDLFQLMSDAAGSVRMSQPQIKVDLQLSQEQWPIHTDTGRMMQVFVSMLAGTVTTPHPVPETVIVEMRIAGEELELVVEGSPLADRNRENQESLLRHQINRLTLEYFGGSYATDFEHRIISVIFSKEPSPSQEKAVGNYPPPPSPNKRWSLFRSRRDKT